MSDDVVEQLHDAIESTIADAHPGLKECSRYPRRRRKLGLPAAYVDLERAERSDDQEDFHPLWVRAEWAARAIYDPTAPEADLKARQLALSIAATVERSRFGLSIPEASVIAVEVDEFSPELDGYVVWVVRFENHFRLGDTYWEDGDPVPDTVYTSARGEEHTEEDPGLDDYEEAEEVE